MLKVGFFAYFIIISNTIFFKSVHTISCLVLIVVLLHFIYNPYCFVKWKKGLSGIFVHDEDNAGWNIVIGKYLKNLSSKVKVAVFWAGGVAYWSELYAVDMLGLNEKYIASILYKGLKVNPGHGKFDYDYVFNKYDPDYIVGFLKEPENFNYADYIKNPKEHIKEYAKNIELSPWPFYEGLSANETFLNFYFSKKIRSNEVKNIPYLYYKRKP